MFPVGSMARVAGRVLLLMAVGSIVPASAATNSDRTGSILIFPKVVFHDQRETIIQITNTNNMPVFAHCYYVNSAPICIGAGDCLAGTCTGRCEPQWQEVDFSIVLTKQQPTHWLAGTGRFPNALDPPCDPITPKYDCSGAGLDPGRIPPVTQPFLGELRCIQVDPSGAPMSGNHLKGEATILSPDGDASAYNAVTILGIPFANNGDMTLCLGGGVSEDCPSGAEYEGCASEILIDHFSEGADAPLFGPASTVDSELTLVPCAVDFERQQPSRVVVHFNVTNEFEQPLSAITTIECWASFFLRDVSNIFDVRTVGTRMLLTRLRPGGVSSGVVGVLEEHHKWNGAGARAAFNLHERGTLTETNLIVLPEQP
jgi:hypothetical protein